LIKQVHFIATTTDVDAPEFATLFFDNVVRLHGVPDDIVSDRGSLFTSEFWTCVCQKLGIQRKLSTAFHPQTDGQTERANRVLEDMLRHYVNPACDDWDEFLSAAEFAVNSSVNVSTKFAPFYLAYGEIPPSPLVLDLGRKGPTKGHEVAAKVADALKKAKSNLAEAQSRAKRYADLHRREVEFKVGDLVLLSTKNLKLRVRKDTKLLPKFVGPCRVLQRIGNVAYRLELPRQWRVHDVFHVSLLRKYVSRGNQGFVAAPPVEWLSDEPLYEVEAILDHHVPAPRGRAPARKPAETKYLVKWAGYDHLHNSWEKESNLINCAEALADYWQRANATKST